MQEIHSVLGWEDSLDKKMAMNSSGNALQVFFPGKSMDRGPWWVTDRGATKESDTIR